MQVQSFDSFDEMMDAVTTNRVIANAHLADEQKALTWGSHYINFNHVADDFLIVGRVHTLEEVEAGERACYTDEFPAEPGELEYTLDSIKAQHEAGYLFGTAYSIVEPRGELGDTHRASAWPITEALFLALQQADYNPGNLDFLATGLADQLYDVFVAWRTHEVAKAATLADTQLTKES